MYIYVYMYDLYNYVIDQYFYFSVKRFANICHKKRGKK